MEPILEDEKGEETKEQDDEIEIIESFHPFHSAKPLTDTLKTVRPDPWPPPDSLSNAGETNDNMNSRDLTMREVDQIELISKNPRFKELVDIFLKSNKKTMYGNKIELKELKPTDLDQRNLYKSLCKEASDLYDLKKRNSYGMLVEVKVVIHKIFKRP